MAGSNAVRMRGRQEAALAAELERLRNGTELERLRRENDALRDRVEELQQALGMSMPVPAGFADQCLKSRRHVWYFICALAKRGTLTREAAMILLYGHEDPDRRPDPKVLDVYLCGARKFLERHGVTVNTVWGQGWSLTKPMQIRVQAIIDRLVKGEAA